jgi:hypothetical protein
MSVTPVSNIPISVDYTGRDYYTLRDQLITRVQDRIPNWTASSPADFGVALVEAFAYLGDLINYYIDRNANENSLATATQRNSLLNIAQTYGYIPAGYRQAYCNITFHNASTSDVTLYSGTVVSGQIATTDIVQKVYFTTIADAIVTAGSSYAVGAVEGQVINYVNADADATYGELIGPSSGTPNMSFKLLETPVADGSIQVYVQDGDVYSKWTQVQHLLDYGPTDLVYTVYVDDTDVVYINFGDGVSGAIPVNSSNIRAMYTVGGGAIGSIAAGDGSTTPLILDTLEHIPTKSDSEVIALRSTITIIQHTDGVGGSDPESNDQIRQSAANTLRAANRAVTLKDFSDLSLSVPGMGKAKANATAGVWTSVTLYIAPSRNANQTDLQPGLNSDNSVSNEYLSLKSSVLNFLADKTLIGTTVTVSPPTYVDCYVGLQYVKLPQYTTSEVETSLKQVLLTVYGYTGMNFQDTIYPQDIEYSLNQAVSGIKTVKVTGLGRLGSSGINTLTGAAGEIFRFQEANITVGP